MTSFFASVRRACSFSCRSTMPRSRSFSSVSFFLSAALTPLVFNSVNCVVVRSNCFCRSFRVDCTSSRSFCALVSSTFVSLTSFRSAASCLSFSGESDLKSWIVFSSAASFSMSVALSATSWSTFFPVARALSRSARAWSRCVAIRSRSVFTAAISFWASASLVFNVETLCHRGVPVLGDGSHLLVGIRQLGVEFRGRLGAGGCYPSGAWRPSAGRPAIPPPSWKPSRISRSIPWRGRWPHPGRWSILRSAFSRPANCAATFPASAYFCLDFLGVRVGRFDRCLPRFGRWRGPWRRGGRGRRSVHPRRRGPPRHLPGRSAIAPSVPESPSGCRSPRIRRKAAFS